MIDYRRLLLDGIDGSEGEKIESYMIDRRSS